ncbi:hypothetical protein QFC20_005463 [Naganishia adeliensis]|uniref:Uncharacterized protein n=1 Tax=Naganishia adeliensis TaxID=92952 RepID=A0ACC2VNW7_9TREE|nr:hypothetical protein QFC20_005463 [Naganishia adeliensis]
MITDASYVTDEISSAVEPTGEVRYIPLKYTTPSEKRYGIRKDASGRRAKATAAGAADRRARESLMSLRILWHWALQHVIEESTSDERRLENEDALDSAIKRRLEDLLGGMSDEVQANLKQWQEERRLNEGYSQPPISRKREPSPYDLTVIRFPVDGWQPDSDVGNRGSEFRVPPHTTKYRYYGFRMTLGDCTVDVGSVIKAITVDCRYDTECPQPGRRPRWRWLRDRAAVIKESLQHRSLGFGRKVDKFLDNEMSWRNPALSLKDGETVSAPTGCLSSGFRSSFSRPTSMASTCVPTSPHTAPGSTHTLPIFNGTRRRYTIENDRPSIHQRSLTWRSSQTNAHTLIDGASLRHDSSLSEKTVLGAISYAKARARFQADLEWEGVSFSSH